MCQAGTTAYDVSLPVIHHEFQCVDAGSFFPQADTCGPEPRIGGCKELFFSSS